MVFVTLEVKNTVAKDGEELFNDNVCLKFFEEYPTSQDFRDTWNELQDKLRCCGCKNYLDYESNINSLYPTLGITCVPDSCLIKNGTQQPSKDDCKPADKIPNGIWKKIYVVSCMDVIREKYKEELGSGNSLISLDFYFRFTYVSLPVHFKSHITSCLNMTLLR